MDKDYFIEIDGEKITVTEEVYRAFKRPTWREHKQKQVRKEKELSLDAFSDAGYDLPSNQALIDDIIADKLLLDQLMVALAELTEDEQILIDALFYQEKSERDVAIENNRSKTAVHKQKEKILQKLRNLLK